MAVLNKQCRTVKLCFLLSKNSAADVVMLKNAYKNNAMGKTQVPNF